MYLNILFGAMVYLFVCQGLALHDNDTDYRIYKGIAPFDGQFQFMVFIIVNLYQAKGIKPASCSGSLIKFDTVLTVAHCLKNPFKTPNYENKPGNIVVMVGRGDALEYYKFRVKNPMHIKFTTKPPETHQESIASQIFEHPKYKERNVYDVGIIKIAKPFQRTQYVNTIPISTDEYPGKITCVVLGFGENHLRNFGQLYFFTTQKIKNNVKDCGLQVSSTSVYCLRKESQSDPSACEGDSGGPLVCQKKVYGIYKGIVTKNPDEEYCGALVINTFIKLSNSEKDQQFVKSYAQEMDSRSSKNVHQFSCLLYIILIFKVFLKLNVFNY